jgi:hypothetical protein
MRFEKINFECFGEVYKTCRKFLQTGLLRALRRFDIERNASKITSITHPDQVHCFADRDRECNRVKRLRSGRLVAKPGQHGRKSQQACRGKARPNKQTEIWEVPFQKMPAASARRA